MRRFRRRKYQPRMPVTSLDIMLKVAAVQERYGPVVALRCACIMRWDFMGGRKPMKSTDELKILTDRYKFDGSMEKFNEEDLEAALKFCGYEPRKAHARSRRPMATGRNHVRLQREQYALRYQAGDGDRWPEPAREDDPAGYRLHQENPWPSVLGPVP